MRGTSISGRVAKLFRKLAEHISCDEADTVKIRSFTCTSSMFTEMGMALEPGDKPCDIESVVRGHLSIGDLSAEEFIIVIQSSHGDETCSLEQMMGDLSLLVPPVIEPTSDSVDEELENSVISLARAETIETSVVEEKKSRAA